MDDCLMLTDSQHGFIKALGFRYAKGFDFLGYRFNATDLSGLAQKAINNFNERRARLFEHGATKERIGNMKYEGLGG